MVVAFGFSTPRSFSSSKLQLYSLASRLALLRFIDRFGL